MRFDRDTKATIYQQHRVRLGEHSEPQPDLALVRRREDFYSECQLQRLFGS